MGIQPGDIQYPYVEPVWSDDPITAPPDPPYVPPHDTEDQVSEPGNPLPEEAPPPPPAEPAPEPEG